MADLIQTTPEFLAFYRRCRSVLPAPAAARTFAYIAEWQAVLYDEGLGDLDHYSDDEGLGLEDFCKFAGVSRASVYRRNADFRRVFPECSTPADLLRAA